ncbi:hypothetical protein [Aporhodopirellula aestuarii]|uniref:Secreted protein n=1 Tax=Aporhodopirellula aestuarii TaxID=2950107 RepID=A0ABT0U855_9BACT|nr:hypothetical protein [Aporhodopirellula aestuarii]MCM2372992.1 hypothetical protein [Aporhodopirellula aestuarii]
MRSRILLCTFIAGVIIGCSSPEASSVADGLSQQQIDDYNALVEQEAKLAAEAEEIGKGE